MPRRPDIHKVLIIGSGPIVIGQGCEFDYSGSQSCRALREEGCHITLINSNPATIMTDPFMADSIYVQMEPEAIIKVIEKERPDVVLPTMGGQTALNITRQLQEQGIWEKYNVDIIGADMDVVKNTEDRERFRRLMESINIDQCKSGTATSLLEAKDIIDSLGGLPVVIRPSFTLGGSGGGIIWHEDEVSHKILYGLEQSPIHQVLIEECIYGWKEYELELLRDKNENVVIVCSIENVDPMGIHTGDSITVAPVQTLTDYQLQAMRDAAIKMVRAIGKFSGGCNVQFAFEPGSDRFVAIEINPRVSRSSALASKATGFPIAKISTKLALGYTLDELKNQITQVSSACFEPSLDYVVVKVPFFNMDKFPGVDQTLSTQMKAVGEVMAIGRTFAEAINKAYQSLEDGSHGIKIEQLAHYANGQPMLDLYHTGEKNTKKELSYMKKRIEKPYWDRFRYVYHLLRHNISVDEIIQLTSYDLWFVEQLADIVALEKNILSQPNIHKWTKEDWMVYKQAGFSDYTIAQLVSLYDKTIDEDGVRALREKLGVKATFKLVDTCAAEFPAQTPYYYSTYENENESYVSEKPKIIIMGSGPNRIGQGIEFDYSCVHAVMAAKTMGYEPIMINCNPETVSTDFDIADKLYFEPIHWEHVYNIIRHEKPIGVLIQVGGQTALKLGKQFVSHNINILGTPFEKINLAEDRGLFSNVLTELKIPFPNYGMAFSVEEAISIVKKIQYPVLIRPSYVLGGQGMRIAINEKLLTQYVKQVMEKHTNSAFLIDHYIDHAIEVDVDSIYDGKQLYIAGIMQHIEPAGVHSGDSTAIIPSFSLSEGVLKKIKLYQEKIAEALHIRGFLNVQYIIKGENVYVIEANPRSTRTIPFLAKAHQLPIAQYGVKVMLGAELKDFDLTSKLKGWAIKEPIFSFDKFPEVKKTLGPEMRSIGEAIHFVDTLKDEHITKPDEIKDLYLSE